jgi:hypothetical protein
MFASFQFFNWINFKASRTVLPILGAAKMIQITGSDICNCTGVEVSAELNHGFQLLHMAPSPPTDTQISTLAASGNYR